jgi:DNA polymerase-4
MRILCVLLPHFPWRCEARRHPEIAGRLAFIVRPKDSNSSQSLVLDHSPGMKRIPSGISAQEAMARYGNAEIVHADIPYYQATFNGILDALELVSPLVEGAELGCVYIGIDGLHLIYKDDEALVRAVREVVADYEPQIGIADNKFLAFLAAHDTPPGSYKVLSGDIRHFPYALPCDVLPVSLKSRELLRDFGLATLGQIAALPEGPFQSQFGPEGKRIWELACGIDDTPLYPRFLEEVIEENITLPSISISIEAITAAMESLLNRIFARRMRGRGIRRLVVWTRTWNAGHWDKNINFKEPAMDTSQAMPRIRRVLEEFPQPGPVEQVGIRITGLGYPRGQQNSLFHDVRAQEHLAEDIRQLELKLGCPQVYKVQEVEPWSRIPERRFVLKPANR